MRIKDIERPRTVTGCLVDEMGKQFRLVYWNNGERKCEWVFEWEIGQT